MRTPRSEDSITVELSAEASITLTFRGNLFGLTAADRDLITNLTNAVQKYNEAKFTPDIFDMVSNRQDDPK